MKKLLLLLCLGIILVAGCGQNQNSTTVETWTDEGIVFSPDQFTNAIIVADPSVLTMADGTYRMYFSIAKTGVAAALYYATSSDGAAWTAQPAVLLADVSVSRPYKLSDGRIRLYYNANSNSEFLSAISSDGLSWTVESGKRLSLSSDGEDKAAIDMGTVDTFDGSTYRMYYGGAKTSSNPIPYKILSATSADGLDFTRELGVRFTSDTGRATHPHVFKHGSKYIMYYSTNNIVYKATSDNALTWTEIGSTGVAGNDPFVMQLSNGNWRMFYGTYDATTGKGYIRSALATQIL